MARTFVAASSQYLERDASFAPAAFTMACWFRSTTITASQLLMVFSTIGVNTNSYDLAARGDLANDPLRFSVNDGTNTHHATTSTGYSADTWHHACAVLASTTDRRVFLDGAGKGTSTDSNTPTGLDRFSIGRFGGLASGSFMDGRIAEAAMWDVALTDDEVASLSKGFSPRMIRPQSIVAYWPLFGNDATELDRSKNAHTLTVTGATKGDHPRIYYPSRMA